MAWFAIAVAASSGLIGCGTPPSPGDGRPVVAVTVAPQEFLIRTLAGDRVETVTMLPPGSNPHAFEPSMSELRALERATIYVSIGHPSLPFEQSWLPRVLADRDDLERVTAIEGMAVLDHDPHVWASPEAMRQMARTVTAALVRTLPGEAGVLRENLAAFESGVDSLQAGFRDALEQSGMRRFYVFHPAWGYLAEELGIEQIAVEDHGHEPSPDRLARLIDAAKRDATPFLLVSPQSSRKGSAVFASAVGARVVISDPMSPDWWKEMWALVRLFAAPDRPWGETDAPGPEAPE